MAVVALPCPARDDVLELFAELWERHPADWRLRQIHGSGLNTRIHRLGGLPSGRDFQEPGALEDPSLSIAPSTTLQHASAEALESPAGDSLQDSDTWSPGIRQGEGLPDLLEKEKGRLESDISQESAQESHSLKEEPHSQDAFPLMDDLLTHIFMSLPPNDLSHAGQVCRRWRELATSPGLHSLCFRKTWGLDKVEGSPSRLSFWRLDFPPFVLRHHLKSSDSVTSVAVQHGCLPASIRRANNMMSDHAIHSRTQLLIPVTPGVIQNTQQQQQQQSGSAPPALSNCVEQQSGNAATEAQFVSSFATQLKLWLRGKRCRIEFDSFAKRDIAVVHEELACREEEQGVDEDSSSVTAQQREAKRADARAKVVRLLMRAFGVDEATASYYLEQSDGDVRVASQEMRNDLSWESSHRTGPTL